MKLKDNVDEDYRDRYCTGRCKNQLDDPPINTLCFLNWSRASKPPHIETLLIPTKGFQYLHDIMCMLKLQI